MSKGWKITLVILAVILAIILGFVVYVLAVSSTAKLDESKLINFDRTITLYNDKNEKLNEISGINDAIKYDEIPTQVINAFIAAEDKRFYQHNGVDYKGLIRATFNNIKSFSFKEGASTISQQLIKNTHLSSEKTLNRKFIEIKLAKDLEKRYTKEQIIEKYLNTIYFGDNCFGIASAAKHYFDKKPEELTISEGAALAGLIKSPSNYSPSKNKQKCNDRKNLVLKQMYEQGYINSVEFESAKNDVIVSKNTSGLKRYNLLSLVKNELNDYVEKNVYSTDDFRVYTSYNDSVQQILENAVPSECDEHYFKIMVMDKNANIVAYLANCPDYRRQLGSTIKPLIAYAPAIEENIVDTFTIINDEKTDFGGYSPSNYRDIYLGNISVKTALAKSSNVCAVKLLNYTGINRAKSYISRTNIPITDEDNSLVIALGATKYGASLLELVSSYSVFLNGGNLINYGTINKIDGNNLTIFQKSTYEKQVFSQETAHIMNDMMTETVKSGTAKKLSFLNIPLCAKTGTVGNGNGNTDAYSISYNSEYIVAVWMGNKENELLPNSITGGGLPTNIATNIWGSIYSSSVYPEAFTKSEKVIDIKLDKISYDNLDVKLADDFAPDRYVINTITKNYRVPQVKSNRFSSPIIDTPKLLVNNNEISIQLCLTELYNAKVYRLNNGKKQMICDTKNLTDKSIVYDSLDVSGEYVYSVIPYYFDGEFYKDGTEIILPKIKYTASQIPKEWWREI